jgi:pyruvate/2-oxoglutarate dehydrogenase complex dihydrolipoamide dehydrogenase (E3) component
VPQVFFCDPPAGAVGLTADLADRTQAERVCQQLAAEHADATLLVNASPVPSGTSTAA